jgi:hypothetical protein
MVFWEVLEEVGEEGGGVGGDRVTFFEVVECGEVVGEALEEGAEVA